MPASLSLNKEIKFAFSLIDYLCKLGIFNIREKHCEQVVAMKITKNVLKNELLC